MRGILCLRRPCSRALRLLGSSTCSVTVVISWLEPRKWCVHTREPRGRCLLGGRERVASMARREHEIRRARRQRSTSRKERTVEKLPCAAGPWRTFDSSSSKSRISTENSFVRRARLLGACCLVAWCAVHRSACLSRDGVQHTGLQASRQAEKGPHHLSQEGQPTTTATTSSSVSCLLSKQTRICCRAACFCETPCCQRC